MSNSQERRPHYGLSEPSEALSSAHNSAHLNRFSGGSGRYTGSDSQTPFESTDGWESLGLSSANRASSTGLLGRVISATNVDLSTSLVAFPLRYTDEKDENKFYQRIASAFSVRARFLGAMTTIIFCCYLVLILTCVNLKTFPTSGTRSRTLLAVCLSLIIPLAWLPTVTALFKRTRPYLEYSVYAFVQLAEQASNLRLLVINFLQSVLLIGLWVALNAMWEESDNVLGIVQFQRTKIWVNVLVYVVPLWGCCLMDIIIAARTCTSFYAHLLALVTITICNVIQAVAFLEKAKVSLDIISTQREFMIISTIADTLFIVCVMALLFVGRWVLEFQERVEFLKRMRATEQIRKLKDRNAKKRKKKGATVIEEILSLVERAVDNVDEVLVDTNMPILAEGSALLKHCQEILTETDNLYTVHVGQVSEGDPMSAMEEQFLHLYGEGNGIGGNPRGLTRLPTKVRFGEVTGVEYDQGEAASAVARAGISTSASLQRFPLFLLHDTVKRAYKVAEATQPVISSADMSRVGTDWDLNMLDFAARYPNVLLETGVALLGDKISALRAAPNCLYNYLMRLQATYAPNPYHNATHGATVAHTVVCLMRMLRMHESTEHKVIDDITICLAALGHDAGHGGYNNKFYTNRGSPLALVYGDTAILENAHCTITFKCLEEPSCNLFAECSADVFKAVRKRIIELILATDMGQHFEFLSRFRLRRQAQGFNYMEDVEDRWLTLKMCIKAADLSHSLVDWNQHVDWSLRVLEEFYQQGDQEKAMGLPISPLCDRSSHGGMAKSQLGFLEFVVMPLLAQMEDLQQNSLIAVECVRRLTYNRYKWEEWAKASHATEMPLFENERTDHLHPARTLALLFSDGGDLEETKQRQRLGQFPGGTEGLHPDDSIMSDRSDVSEAVYGATSPNSNSPRG